MILYTILSFTSPNKLERDFVLFVKILNTYIIDRQVNIISNYFFYYYPGLMNIVDWSLFKLK